MALRLTVQRAAWHAHVDATAAAVEGLVPVVKGNGYGFGRATLHPIAASLSDSVCVGTVAELDHVETGVTAVVLTPTLVPPRDESVVLTVGSVVHVQALAGWRGAVLVKLESSMHRFGTTPAALETVIDAAHDTGLEIAGFSLHLPLAASPQQRRAEVEGWLAALDHLDRSPLWLSHVDTGDFEVLQRRHVERSLRLRLGTQLWHGDKSFLHLSADVLATHPIKAGERAGYRQVEVPADGTIVVIGAGSAHGVSELTGGASPFHHARTRIALLEPPHMHSSMTFVPSGAPCPVVGDRVDVQRPLIHSCVDEIEWR